MLRATGKAVIASNMESKTIGQKLKMSAGWDRGQMRWRMRQGKSGGLALGWAVADELVCPGDEVLHVGGVGVAAVVLTPG